MMRRPVIALLIVFVGCAPKTVTVTPIAPPTAPADRTAEEALASFHETPETKALSAARMELEGLVRAETPPSDAMEDFQTTFFESGQSDVRYRFVNPDQLWCQRKVGNRGETVWKIHLLETKAKKPPAVGTLRWILNEYGESVKGPESAEVMTALDKHVAYAGYAWTCPEATVRTSYYDLAGALTEGVESWYPAGAEFEAWYPISLTERNALGWK